MARIHRLNLFASSLSKRLVFGGLLIHVILIPLLFYGIAVIVKEGYEQRFIDQVRSNARSFSTLLPKDLTIENIQTIIDNALFEGRVVFAKTAPFTTNDAHHADSFQEDFFFGQHNDKIYYIAVPVETSSNIVQLQLGYDETTVHEQIQTTYLSGLYLAIGYVILSMVFGTLMGSQVTRPIRKLRDVAREVASGASTKKLTIETSVSEVASLAHDLESMRQKLVRTTEEIATREMYIRDVMNNVMDGIITVNEACNIESLNPAVERLFGYKRADLIGKNIALLFTPQVTPQVDSDAPQRDELSFTAEGWTLSNTHHLSLQEVWGKRSDNSEFPLEITSRQLSLDQFGHHIIVARDMTAHKQADAEIKALHRDLEQRVEKRTRELAAANERLEYQAMHDALTDLPNRVLLQDRLNQSIYLAQRNNTTLALLILDLNNFKEINDTLGHHVGDLLLQQVAERMHCALRASDTISRVGGDEFALLLPTDVTLDHACQTAQKLVTEMEESFVLKKQRFHVGVSIGVALYPEHGTDRQTLMRHADVAMYVAKRKGTGYSVYDPAQDEHSLSRLELMGELRHAIERDELVLYYQPKFDLKQSRISELEVLIRWQHPQRGLLLPDEFIGLAEHSGLIHTLSKWIIGKAIHQCGVFHQDGLDVAVAINLSMHNLRDSSLPQQVADTLEKYQLPPNYLILEITESAVMADPRHAVEILGQLNNMGVRLAIDDFGTGYSSLSYLKQLPVDEIKIDKSFVLDMTNDNDDLIIVRSTIDLAHNMGRKVTAEGVETQEAWEQLATMGCDSIQGYYIAQSMPADEIMDCLTRIQPKA